MVLATNMDVAKAVICDGPDEGDKAVVGGLVHRLNNPVEYFLNIVFYRTLKNHFKLLKQDDVKSYIRILRRIRFAYQCFPQELLDRCQKTTYGLSHA